MSAQPSHAQDTCIYGSPNLFLGGSGTIASQSGNDYYAFRPFTAVASWDTWGPWHQRADVDGGPDDWAMFWSDGSVDAVGVTGCHSEGEFGSYEGFFMPGSLRVHTFFAPGPHGVYLSYIDNNTGVGYAPFGSVYIYPACSDGIDNDGDGQTDSADAQCTPGADSELDSTAAAAKSAIFVKLDAVPDDPQVFNFTASGGLSTSFQLDDDGDATNAHSNARGFEVAPGNGYSISQALPSGWRRLGASCDDGSPPTNIDVSAGETVTCTFTNAPLYNERPASADTLAVALVPVFKQCGTGGNGVNSKHAPGLSVGSCNPPKVTSNQAFAGPSGSGSAILSVSSGDVALTVSDSDIQTATGSDYDPTPGAPGGDLRAIFRIRLTDNYNCSPSPCSASYDRPGSGTDTDFGPIPIDCEANGSPTASPGSDCNLSTTANTFMPGAVVSGQQAIWQVFRVRVLDGGDTLFQQQGFLAP